MPRTYLTSEQAADEIGVSLSTLAKWRVAGKGPPFKRLGGRVYYPEQEISRYLDEQEAELDGQPLHASTAAYSTPGRHTGRPPRQPESESATA
jgi:predicted DNA-binding transcriptional regulator AlpA